MPRDHNDSEYDCAMEASRLHKDTRTHDQRVWDAHVYAVNELIRKLGTMTCRPWLGEPSDPYGYHAALGEPAPLAPHYLEHVASLSADLQRKLNALQEIGYREGSPAPAMPTLKQISTRTVQFQGEDAA